MANEPKGATGTRTNEKDTAKDAAVAQGKADADALIDAMAAALADANAESFGIGTVKGTGRKSGSRVPLSQVAADAIGSALRNPGNGPRATGGLSSLTDAHVAAVVTGGTFPVRQPDGSTGTVTYGPVPVGLAIFSIGHKARNEPDARGVDLFHIIARHAAGLLPKVVGEDGTLTVPEPHEPYVVTAARWFVGSPLPKGIGIDTIRRAARGESYVYGRAQNG